MNVREGRRLYKTPPSSWLWSKVDLFRKKGEEIALPS